MTEHKKQNWLVATAWALGVLVVVLVLVIGWAEGRDFSWAFRDEIETRLTAEIGHPVRVEGRVGFDLSVTELRIFADQISTDVGEETSTLEASIDAERAGVVLGLWSLIGGEVELRELYLREARITLPVPGERETEETADRNPEFILNTIRRLRRVTLDNLHLTRQRRSGPPQEADIDHLIVEPRDQGLVLAFVGDIEGTPYDVTGYLEQFNDFLNFRGSPASITASIGRNSVEAVGTVSRLWPFEAELDLAGRAENVSRLAQLIGVSLPDAGEGRFSGQLLLEATHAEASLRDMVLFPSTPRPGEAADPSVGPGTAEVRVDRRRDGGFVVNGSINLERAELDGFVNGLQNSAELSATEIAEMPLDFGLPFAQRSIPYDFLNRFEGRVDFHIGEARYRDAVFQGVEFPLLAGEGFISLEGAGARYRDGSFFVSLRADTLSRRLHLQGAANMLELGQMIEEMGGQSFVHGTTHLAIDGTGGGATVGEVLSSFSGQSNLMIGPGRLERGGIDFLAADLLQVFFSSNRNQATTPLQCFVNRIDFAEGVGTSRAFLLDTDLITITGRGEVSLADNEVDFRLAPRPKDPTLLSLAADYTVRGPITDPRIRADTGDLIRGVATTIGGFALTGGTAALLPLIAGRGEPVGNVCLSTLSGEEPIEPVDESGQ